MTVTIDISEARANLLAHFERVADDALQLMLDEMVAKAPRDTGDMTNTITINNESSGTTISRRIGAPVEYASWQDQGTGIFAGEGRIYPHPPNKALHFHWRKMGVDVFFASVAGTPPTYWWSDRIAQWGLFVAAALV